MSGKAERAALPRPWAKLKAEDLYWVWWLNLRSLDLLAEERSEAPYLRVDDDGKRLELGLEKVRWAGKPIWTSPGAIDDLMALKRGFAQAGKSVAGFERGLGPETAMSPQLRWVLERALERYALSRVPCIEGVKSAAVLSMIRGWDGKWFEGAGLHTRGVDEDGGDRKRGVEVSGEQLDHYLCEAPLWEVFQWLTYAACLMREDWKPWEGDERWFTVKWTRGSRGAWRRWVRVVSAGQRE